MTGGAPERGSRILAKAPSADREGALSRQAVRLPRFPMPAPSSPLAAGTIDLHSHSTESDGVLPPAEVVEQAAGDGVRVLALTDHDTMTGFAAASEAAAVHGIELVAGVEVSCTHGAGSVHLLGLFVDPEDRALVEFFAEVAHRRRERIMETCAALRTVGVDLEFEEVAAQFSGRSLGRPHVADALVAKGVVADRKEAFDRYLAEGRAGHIRYGWKISVPDAARMLHAAGGITSIAHPKFLDDQAQLIPMLRESGVRAVEAYHAEQSGEERTHYETLADSLGLMVTGGSDFHQRVGGKTFGSDLPVARYEELLAAAA